MEQSGKLAVSRDLEAQREYVGRMESENFAFDLTVADAFIRGIRDIGYKSTAAAIDELVDNSIQAEATDVFVEFGYHGGSEKKPDEIAIIDDGHGMDPEMIRLSVVWGGTHRENDRNGFGRYGYGLPTASVSQGRRFTVYSRVEGGELHKVTIDVDEIGNGSPDYLVEGRIVVPKAVPAELPGWVREAIELRFEGREMTRGTVVVLEKLERGRLTHTTKTALERHLLEHFGITYRNFLSAQLGISVNGKRVRPVDPLFTTPGHQFYDLDEDRAEPWPTQYIEVKEWDEDGKTKRGGSLGTLTVRYSSLSATFPRKRKDQPGGRGNNNARLSVMRDHQGIAVMREGRQIDVVNRGGWLSSTNNDDRYWGVEIDFPATLDEEFSITTSKQRVILSDRIWEILRENGVYRNIRELRKKYEQDRARQREKEQADQERKRASEKAMEEAEKFKTRKPAETAEKQQKSRDSFEREVNRRSEASGVPREEVERTLKEEIKEHPYRVRTENSPGAPFFRVEQMGGQKVLYINVAHSFYTGIYAGPESTPRLRGAMEVLLFVLGETELDAEGDRELFYAMERGYWSTRLHAVLDRLDRMDSVREAEQSKADALERADEEDAAEAASEFATQG